MCGLRAVAQELQWLKEREQAPFAVLQIMSGLLTKVRGFLQHVACLAAAQAALLFVLGLRLQSQSMMGLPHSLSRSPADID